jgi:hypothetical protein
VIYLSDDNGPTNGGQGTVWKVSEAVKVLRQPRLVFTEFET